MIPEKQLTVSIVINLNGHTGVSYTDYWNSGSTSGISTEGARGMGAWLSPLSHQKIRPEGRNVFFLVSNISTTGLSLIDYRVDDHPWKTAFEGLALPWQSQNPIYSSKRKTVYIPYGNITKLSNLTINYV